MFEAINGMLLDMLAAVARKDYDDRRRRQAQGIAKMKAEGKDRAGGKKPSGRPEDAERNARIARQLRDGVSWSTIQNAEDCSRSTIFQAYDCANRRMTGRILIIKHEAIPGCGSLLG